MNKVQNMYKNTIYTTTNHKLNHSIQPPLLYQYIVHIHHLNGSLERYPTTPRNRRFYDLCSEINKTGTLQPCQSTNLTASRHQQSSLSQRDKRSLEEGLVQLNQKSIC